MNPRLLTSLASLLVLIGTSARAQTTQSAASTGEPGGADLIESLDLSRPELAAVKAAWDRQDLAGARKAFAEELRTRTNVHWHFDPAHPPTELSSGQRKEADDALHHTFVSVNVPWTFDGPIDWKFNPTALPDSKNALNHEWTWQFNRMSYWMALAHAYRATGDKRYAEELDAEILSWVRANPVPARAENRPYSRWRTIEAGIRMFGSWPETFFTMLEDREAFPDDVMLAMVDAIRWHGEYLDAHFTGGNWKTMESDGLFHVGTLFPEFKQAAKWRQDGLQRQHEEISVQVYPDGAQKELAPGYHNVALNNFVATLRLAKMNGIEVPADYQQALEKMYDVDEWLMMPDRTVANFNDSGRVGSIVPLRDGLKLFPGRDDWRWIASDGKEGKPPEQTSHLFPYAGWAVMRSGWERDALCLILQAGPFGAGHQHEDKLNFILDAYGSHLVAEAGVFTYDASPMRRYVLGPEGHNVVWIDGISQNRHGGPRSQFVVKDPVPAQWISNPDFDFVQASFGKLADEKWGPKRVDGFVHNRKVLFAKPDYFVVIDTITPQDGDEHTYDSTFHLDAPAASIDESTKAVTTKNESGANLTIFPLGTSDLSVHIVQGQKDPIWQGWVAETAYKLRPVPTPYFTVKGEGTQTMLLVFSPSAAGKEGPVKSVAPGKAGEGQVMTAEIQLIGGRADEVSVLKDGSVVMKRASGKTFASALEDAMP